MAKASSAMSTALTKIHFHLTALFKLNQVLHTALDIELETCMDGVNSRQ